MRQEAGRGGSRPEGITLGILGNAPAANPVRLPLPPRPSLPDRFRQASALPAALRPLLRDIPGAGQRRRALAALVLAILVLLLRPWPPMVWLPGWCVGGLGLWALVEVLIWLWHPRRWR
jgi:hypothetical protein